MSYNLIDPEKQEEDPEKQEEEPNKIIKFIAALGSSFLFYCLLFFIVFLLGVIINEESNLNFFSLYSIPMMLASLFAGFCLIYQIDNKNYIINQIRSLFITK